MWFLLHHLLGVGARVRKGTMLGCITLHPSLSRTFSLYWRGSIGWCGWKAISSQRSFSYWFRLQWGSAGRTPWEESERLRRGGILHTLLALQEEPTTAQTPRLAWPGWGDSGVGCAGTSRRCWGRCPWGWWVMTVGLCVRSSRRSALRLTCRTASRCTTTWAPPSATTVAACSGEWSDKDRNVKVECLLVSSSFVVSLVCLFLSLLSH